MKKYIILASFILFTSIAKAAIIETNNLSDINDKFTELQQDYQPNDMLIVFSLRDVILKPANPELKRKDDEAASLLKKMFKQAKLGNLIYFDEVLLTNYKYELPDSGIVQLIKEITDKGTPVIGLAGYITGNFNKIDRFEVWLDQYLNKFNISFANSYKESNDVTFNKLKPYAGTYPVFYNGILNCNKIPEDQTFVYFMTNLTIIPKIVVMVSSNVSSLNNVENQIKSYSNNIAFIGYAYVAANEENLVATSDKDLVKFWASLIDKINNVKRINPAYSSSDNPYDK